MLARLAWRMPHEAAIDGCLKSGDVFEGAEREDRVLNIRRGGSVLKKPKVAPTDNHLTNGLRTSDFRTAIIGVTDLGALQQGFPFPRPFTKSATDSAPIFRMSWLRWTFTAASLAPISA